MISATANKENKIGSIDKILIKEYGLPFVLLLILLTFSSFRPDKLLPGGKILTHFPTLILFILGLIWLKTSNKVLNNRQTKLYIAFVALMVVQLPFVRNFGFSMIVVKNALMFGITYYMFRIQYINNHFKIKIYLKTFLFLSIFFGILGILGKGKIDLPVLRDENDFCLFMNILIPIAWFLGQMESNTRKKILYYAAMFVFLFANISTFSRGGFIGLIVVGLYLLFNSKKKFIALFMIGIIGMIVLYSTPQSYWDEIRTIKSESIHEGTGKQRMEYWKAGWRMFVDHPVIGVGALNYGIWLPDYYPVNPKRMWGRVAHSLYITVLSEMGIIGVFIFGAILLANFRDYRYVAELNKNKKKMLAAYDISDKDGYKISSCIDDYHLILKGVSGSMIAFLATGLFISVLWYGYFWILTAYFVIVSNLARNIDKKIRLQPKRDLRYKEVS